MKNVGTKTLETERLILRRFELTDAEDMYKNWASSDQVTQYLTWPTHRDIDVSRRVLEAWVEGYTEEKNYHWCIELKSTGEAIGSIAVVDLKENIEAVEIGYCIGGKFWNQGITSEAFMALIEFFFREVGVNRIEARHDPRNPGSGKVMQKCGLKYEGTRMQADRNNTGVCDVAMYGIIRCQTPGNICK
jgi:ribosomal-protein-alanine N-acetyltransferase